MKLIDKKQDIQGIRYHIAGSFNLITEDWQQKNFSEVKEKSKVIKPESSIKNVVLNGFKINSLIALILFIFNGTLNAQQAPTDANIFGHVTCGDGHLPLSTITIEGTTIGTATDNTGHYKLINLPEGTFTIKVQSIGYKSQTQELTTKAGTTLEINFDIEEDVIALEQIVVSSNRNEVSRKNATTIVNTISPKMFENTNSVCLAEGMSFQPGLRVETNCQNCGFQQVRINGLDGPYTQILIDSRAIFSALSGVYGIEQIPTNMIERVEVVRGGGSALFGSNAIAGTVNIITKEPNYNSFQVASNLSAIDKNSLDRTVNINTSLVSDDNKAGIMMFGSMRKRDHYDANNDAFSELGILENTSFGFRSYFKPTIYSKIIFEYHNLNEFRRGGNKFELQPHETDITEQTDHNINAGGLTYTLLSKNYKSKFSLYTSAQQTKRESYYGAEQDANAYGHTDDLAFVAGSQYNYDFTKFLFAQSTITTGLEYQLNNLHDKMPGYGRDLLQEVGIIGYFVQNEWKTEHLNFLIGARADKHNLINNVILSPRANLLYKITDDFSTRLSYSKGFRAPQAFDEDLHIMAVGGEVMLIQLADDLKTETSSTYSGSFDYYFDIFGLQTNFLIEGFYTKLTDVFVVEEIGTDAQGNMLLERRNGSGAEVYGINTELRTAFSKYLQLQMGFTSQKSKYTKSEQWADDETLEATKYLLRTPDNYGYFTLNFNPIKYSTISLSGVYTGKMYVPHYAGFIDNDKLEESPEFMELNFKLAQNFKIGTAMQLQINGGVQNILNSYQTDFDKGTFRDAGYMYGPSRPRTFFVGIKIGTNL
ncbi:MAG: TonB-dependent receptor [Bacteroidales bacterium]|nr:TonB-dependent receptor [Bacteroidales bacterium]